MSETDAKNDATTEQPSAEELKGVKRAAEVSLERFKSFPLIKFSFAGCSIFLTNVLICPLITI